MLTVLTILDCNYSGCKRAGVVFPPQAIEHGTFSSLLENTYSTHALQMTCTRPFQVLIKYRLPDTVKQSTNTYLSTNTSRQIEAKLLKLKNASIKSGVRCQVCHIVFVVSVCCISDMRGSNIYVPTQLQKNKP